MTSYNYLKEIQRNTFEQGPGPASLVDQIKNRLNHNLDCRILICGAGGIGKSYTALRIGELIDQRFTQDPEGAVKDQVCFRAEEFISSITELPSQSVIVYDEPGQSFMGREFLSEANRIIAKTLVGFRFKMFCSVFCIPGLSLIDKAARILCQYKVDVLRHGYAEWQRILPSRFHDDIWYRTEGSLRIPMPSVKLRHLYEDKKRNIQDSVYKEYLTTLKQSGTKRRGDAEILSEIDRDPSKYMTEDPKKGERRLSINLLEGAFDCDRDKARRLRAKWEYRQSQNVDSGEKA